MKQNGTPATGQGPADENVQNQVPSLLRLPVELLQQIIAYIEYLDIENITLSCHHLLNVAETKLLQHRQLKQRFSRLSCGGTPTVRSEMGTQPVDLLRSILDDPSGAPYVIRLTIRDLAYRQFNGASYKHEVKKNLYDRRNQIIAFFDQNFRHWRGISACHAAVTNIVTLNSRDVLSDILLLLLTIIPNLGTLRIQEQTWNYYDRQWFSVGCEIAALSRRYPDTNQPLRNLESIEITGGPNGLEVLAAFMGLPSLRSARLLRVREGSAHGLRLSPVSDIKKIDFVSCHIARSVLDALFSKTPELRDFSYSISHVHLVDPYHYPCQWAPFHFLGSLLRYASHSLHSLALTTETGSYMRYPGAVFHSFVGCLRGFQVLQDIRLDLILLIDGSKEVVRRNKGIRLANGDEYKCDKNSQDNNEGCSDSEVLPGSSFEIAKQVPIVHRLVNILPASAERLTIEMPANKYVMQQMLCRLPERKAMRLPNLKEIFYECEERCLIGMEEACADVGVRVTQILKYGDFRIPPGNSLISFCHSMFEDREVDEPYHWCQDFYESSMIPYQAVLLPEAELAEDDREVDGELTNVYEDIKHFEWLVSLWDTAPDSWNTNQPADYGGSSRAGLRGICV